MFFDDRRKHGLRHNPFKALVAPRPIAWVSSVDVDGVPNLAPFSYFNACADMPPTIVFAPNNPRPNGEGKDTLRNIEQTNEFVVNLAGYDLRKAMNETSAHVDPSVDEFELAGLTPVPSVHVRAPRIKEAPVSLECRFLTRLRLPSDHPRVENNLVIGQVVGIHIDDRIIRDGMVDMAAYRPIARLGYMDYTSVETVRDARPYDAAAPRIASSKPASRRFCERRSRSTRASGSTSHHVSTMSARLRQDESPEYPALRKLVVCLKSRLDTRKRIRTTFAQAA